MSEQIPAPAGENAVLPRVEISGEALVRFTIEMVAKLHDFEERFFVPRQHPQFQGELRGAYRRRSSV